MQRVATEEMAFLADLEVNTDVMVRLNKDLKSAAKMMSAKEARYLVDLYYAMQDFRIQASGQVRSMGQCEPDSVLKWVFGNSFVVEKDIKAALGVFAAEYAVGQWLQGVCGIGPVLSAAFLSSFDIRERLIAPCSCKDAVQDKRHGKGNRAFKMIRELDDKTMEFRCTSTKCDEIRSGKKHGRRVAGGFLQPSTAGGWWRFAGLDPTVEWKAKTKRPWSARAKVLCFKAGECFIKVQNNDKDVYGKIYAKRKMQEISFNERGRFAEQAADGADRVGKTTEAFKHYDKGMLPPAHVHARARRYAVKLFLSHLHDVSYRDYYKKDPPIPFAFTKNCEGNHTHFIQVPVVEIKKGARTLRELLNGDV